jgi:DNA-directed RNA polymerase specialized sigma24 family protein
VDPFRSGTGHPACRRDDTAFADIFRRHRSRRYRFALRFCKSPLVAEELTYDTFLKIWTNKNELGFGE